MRKGELIIIGGNEEKFQDNEILSIFVELSQKNDGGIGILPTASRIPDEVSEEYVQAFSLLGAKNITVLNVDSREKAEDPEILEQANGLSALFMTGGDQSRLNKLIGGTKLFDLIYKQWNEGMVIGGTSAGASIMGGQMIVAADMKVDDDITRVEMSGAFGLLPETIIDQHFSQRARFDRLMNAIAENPNIMGIGIDENTAILVEDKQFTVYGEHQVMVIDGKNNSFVEVITTESGSEEATVSGFQLHTMTRGYSFDLEERKLLNEKRNEK